MSNTGKQADRLVAASVDVADHAELHTHLNDNGVMKMRQIPDIPVEAGATVKLQPGGLHIMLMDLKQPLKEGDKIPMTLRFEKAGEVKVDVHVDKVAPCRRLPGPTPVTNRAAHQTPWPCGVTLSEVLYCLQAHA